MKIRLLSFVLITAFSASAYPQAGAAQSNPAENSGAPNTFSGLSQDLKTKVEQLGNLQRDFGRGMNSPGVELSLKELGRTRASDRTLVKYGLYATGLPEDKTYTLFQVQLDGSLIKNMEGVGLDGAGRAICPGRPGTCRGNGPNDPIDLIVFAGKSEPKRFALIAEDDSHLKSFVSVVPFPNEKKDKNCKLESIIGTPNGELMFVQASGFEPNADVDIDSQSYSEKHHEVGRTTSEGSLFSAVLPSVKGKKSGKTTWQVTAKSCSPKLAFQWGEGSYHLE